MKKNYNSIDYVNQRFKTLVDIVNEKNIDGLNFWEGVASKKITPPVNPYLTKEDNKNLKLLKLTSIFCDDIEWLIEEGRYSKEEARSIIEWNRANSTHISRVLGQIDLYVDFLKDIYRHRKQLKEDALQEEIDDIKQEKKNPITEMDYIVLSEKLLSFPEESREAVTTISSILNRYKNDSYWISYIITQMVYSNNLTDPFNLKDVVLDDKEENHVIHFKSYPYYEHPTLSYDKKLKSVCTTAEILESNKYNKKFLNVVYDKIANFEDVSILFNEFELLYHLREEGIVPNRMVNYSSDQMKTIMSFAEFLKHQNR